MRSPPTFPEEPANYGWGSTGALFFQGSDGVWVALAIPADWAAQQAGGTPYALGIIAGLPAWVTTAASAIDGLGMGLGDSLGQD